MTDLEALADRVRRRASGDWDALRADWAQEVVVWHVYDDSNKSRRFAELLVHGLIAGGGDR
jgi:hypothetical protein